VDDLHWVALGQLGKLIDHLRSARVTEAVMAGKISKEFLFRRRDELRLDARALAALATLEDRRDDAISSLLARVLEEEGVMLLSQLAVAPDLAVGEGPLGKHHPSLDQLRDIAAGWPVAKTLGAVDVGQTAVVKDRAVLALEAIEGTDAAIRRGAELGGPGVCVVKVAKPAQDARFDVPVVGLGTIEGMRAAGAAVLACEAERTLVVERESAIRAADESGIAVVGIPADGPRIG